MHDPSPVAGACDSGREQVSVREMQKAFTRNLLIDSALVAFDERGFAATTIDDIASVAGVGRGTVYLHFGNKADVLLAGLKRASDLWAFHDKLDLARTRSDLEKTFDEMYEFWHTVSKRIWVHAREAAVVDRDVHEWVLRLIEDYARSIQIFLERRGVSSKLAQARAFLLLNTWTEFIYRMKDGGCDLERAAVVSTLADFYETAQRPAPPVSPSI